MPIVKKYVVAIIIIAKPYRLPLLATVMVVLVGCAPTRYRNAIHPDYGQTQFDSDQYQCQRENSHQVLYVNGYGAAGGTEVDQGMTQSCMAAKG